MKQQVKHDSEWFRQRAIARREYIQANRRRRVEREAQAIKDLSNPECLKKLDEEIRRIRLAERENWLY